MGESNFESLLNIETLAKSLGEIYQLWFWINLSKNEFGTLESSAWEGRNFKSSGDYDMLLARMRTLSGEDLAVFLEVFGRQQLLKAYDEGKKMVSLRHKQLTKDGEVHWVETTALFLQPINGDKYAMNFVRIIDDEIAEEQKHKETLQKVDHYEDVLTGLSESFEGIYYIDLKDDSYMEFNPKGGLRSLGMKITGKDFFNEMSENLLNITEEFDRDELSDFLKKDSVIAALGRGNTISGEYRFLIDGKPVYYRIRLFMCNQQEQKMILAIENVDESVRAEKERNRKYQKALREAKNRAEMANEAKTAFLANMSHDIRTPLNSIMGFTDLALNNVGNPEKLDEYLKKSKQACNYLVSFANDLLDMVQIESGQMCLHPTKILLDRKCTELEFFVRVLTEGRNRQVEFVKGQIFNSCVQMDDIRFGQILTNLLSNAVKFTNDGDLIRVSFEQLEGVSQGYGMYRLTVEDSGIGMSEDFLERIGGKFTTEVSTTISQQRGVGVGLAIIMHIVNLMGGKLDISSTLGKGSKFEITIPLKILQDENAASDGTYIGSSFGNSVHEGAVGEGLVLDGKRILVAEDNLINQTIMKEMLTQNGGVVEIADNGSVAVENVRSHDAHYYDVILMDIMMPVMDGYEATVQIRDIYPERHIPIIAVSANSYEEDKEKSLEIGMDDHLPKPVVLKDLLESIDKNIQRFK